MFSLQLIYFENKNILDIENFIKDAKKNFTLSFASKEDAERDAENS